MKFNKKPLITLGLSIICLTVFSQTYVGAYYGKSWMRIERQPPPSNVFQLFYIQPEDGYQNDSHLYGIRIDQALSDKFIFSFSGFTTSKVVSYSDFGIGGRTHFKFRSSGGSIVLNHQPFSKFLLGFGGSYNRVHQLKIGKPSVDAWNDIGKAYNVHAFALVFSSSFRFKGFLLEARWIKGGNTFGEFDTNQYIKNMDSFELTIGYMLKVFGKK